MFLFIIPRRAIDRAGYHAMLLRAPSELGNVSFMPLNGHPKARPQGLLGPMSWRLRRMRERQLPVVEPTFK
jgi:hypothetical protein